MTGAFSLPGSVPPVPPMYPAGPTVLGFLYGLLDAIQGSGALTNVANTFSELQTMMAGTDSCLDDTNGAGISYPLSLCHGNSAGLGEAGIGCGVQFQTEKANIEDALDTIGWLQAQTTQVGPGVTDSNLQLHVLDVGTEVEAMRLSGRHVDVLLTPPNSAVRGMLNLGEGGFSGGGTNFAGSSAGTVLAVNSPGTYSGDLTNLEQDGVSRWRVHADGRCGVGTSTTPTALLHLTRAAKFVPDPNFLSYLKVSGAADTFVQPSDEPTDVFFDFARTVNLDTGDRLALRSMRINGGTYSAVGTSTVTEGATLAIAGGPAATGGNLTFTNSYSLWCTGTARFDPGAQPHVWKLPQNDTPLTGGIVGRIPINVGGVTRFVPYYAS